MLDVTDTVERRELLGEEPARLLEDSRHCRRIGVLVAGELGDGGEVGDVVQYEAHVQQRCRVVAHWRKRYGLSPGVLAGSTVASCQARRTTVG